MKSFAQFLKEAGENLERQERGFIEAINSAVEQNKGPITLKAGGTLLKGVSKAEKVTGLNSVGSEQYADVVLTVGKKHLKISMKGTSAPSLAGGGLDGIEAIIPGIADKFLKAAHKEISKKFKAGDKIPNVYGILNDKDKLLLVKGNASVGGPIDYMYVGPMDVKTKFEGGILEVNGDLTESEEYASKKELYFRLRARREDQTFDPEAKTKSGIPKIYGKSPSKGDSAGRLVVTDTVSSKGIMVEF